MHHVSIVWKVSELDVDHDHFLIAIILSSMVVMISAVVGAMNRTMIRTVITTMVGAWLLLLPAETSFLIRRD